MGSNVRLRKAFRELAAAEGEVLAAMREVLETEMTVQAAFKGNPLERAIPGAYASIRKASAGRVPSGEALFARLLAEVAARRTGGSVPVGATRRLREAAAALREGTDGQE